MEWIAPSLVALAGIITAVVAWRRAGTEAEQAAATGWQSVASHLQARVTALEAAQDAVEKEAEEARERVRVLQRQHVEDERRFVNLEQDHLQLVKLRRVDKEQLAAVQEQVKQLEEKVSRYRRMVGLLVKQLEENKLTPVVRPDDEETNGGKS